MIDLDVIHNIIYILSERFWKDVLKTVFETVPCMGRKVAIKLQLYRQIILFEFLY